MNPHAAAIIAEAEAIFAARFPGRNPTTHSATIATARLFAEARRNLVARGVIPA